MWGFWGYFSACASFGRPRWLIRITLPPSARIFLMVGTEARIRVSSVISNLSFRGTLKSTRIRAFSLAKLCWLKALIIYGIKEVRSAGGGPDLMNESYLEISFAKKFRLRTSW